MRRFPVRIAAVSAISLMAAQLAQPAQASAPSAAAIDPSSPIKHVVIIYQENHTFDDVLGAVCQRRTSTCNGYTGAVTFADGVTVPNKSEPDLVPNVDHGPQSQRLGMANNWDQMIGCTSSANYACVTHFDPSTIPNVTALANKYAVSDATFAVGDDASFGAHVELGSGTDDGFYGTNPVASKTGATPLAGWGCQSHKDAKWGVGFGMTTFEPSCVPLADGSGSYRKTQVPYVRSLMEQLEGAGLSWKVYNGGSATKVAPQGLWNLCSYFAWCVNYRQTVTNNPGYPAFKTDAANGTLPAVSIIPASGNTSQHNGNSMALGDNYIGQLMSALSSGPEWNSTAVFITYDDCGCFYDHVKPPNGLGLRNPMLIVSPWVKPVSTDSTTAVQPYSMLAFIDHDFGLPALTSQVGNAYDYSNSFDFSGTPIRATPQMVQTHVSSVTKRAVARYNSTHSDDPT